MTVSNVDLLQPRHEPEDRHDRKVQRSESAAGLFSMLLQQTSLQNVASTGLAKDLGLSFPARKEQPATERPAEASKQKPAFRPDPKPTASSDEPAAARPKRPLASRAESDQLAGPGAAATPAPTPETVAQERDVRAAAPNVMPAPSDMPSGEPVRMPAMPAIAAPAIASPQNMAATPAQNTTGAQATENPAPQIAAPQIVPNTRTAQADANTGTQAPIKASVTDTPAAMVSQPANTLAAAAAVSAQTAQGQRKGLAGDISANPGDPTINAALSRAPGQIAVQTARQGDPSAATQGGKPDGASLPQDGTDGPKINAAATPQTMLAASTAQDAGRLQPAGSQAPSGLAVAGHGSGQGTGALRGSDAPPAPLPQRPTVLPRVVADQVAVQIQRALGQGMDRIQIQLRPAELGRVDIRMEIAPDGHMKAAIVAERQDTLDLLQRDARHLQQALQDAGLSTDSNSLQFSLRGDGSAFRGQLAHNGGAGASAQDPASSNDDDTPRARTRATEGSYDIEV